MSFVIVYLVCVASQTLSVDLGGDMWTCETNSSQFWQHKWDLYHIPFSFLMCFAYVVYKLVCKEYETLGFSSIWSDDETLLSVLTIKWMICVGSLDVMSVEHDF